MMHRKIRSDSLSPIQQFRAAMQPVAAVKRIVPDRATVEKHYRKASRRFKKARPWCQVCDASATRDVHHMAGRDGDNMLDERTWLAVCRRCHDAIHHDPKTARARGYLL